MYPTAPTTTLMEGQQTNKRTRNRLMHEESTLTGNQQITVHSLGLRLRAFEKINYKVSVDHVQSEGANGRWGVGGEMGGGV